MRRLATAVAIPALVALLAGCSGDSSDQAEPTHRIIQGAAPGEQGETLTEMPTLPDARITADDVTFVRHMIVHHEQALQMTELVPERTSRDDIPLFAERMELSQEDEIGLMEGWLQEHRLAVLRLDEEEGGHAGHVEDMPGMITDEQLSELAQADGADFDRLFLELMYQHHEGALVMVEDLQQGDQGDDAALWRLVTDIDGDQRIEMDRMLEMLAEIDAGDDDAADATGAP